MINFIIYILYFLNFYVFKITMGCEPQIHYFFEVSERFNDRSQLAVLPHICGTDFPCHPSWL